MKVLEIGIVLCILAGYTMQAQQDHDLPNKRYQAWIIPSRHEPVRDGVLFRIGDSSIVISNSVVTEDYARGYYSLSEMGTDRIEMVKVRKEGKFEKGILIGGIAGAATGLTLGLTYSAAQSESEVFGNFFNVVGAMLITIVGTAAGLGIGVAATGVKISIPIHGRADEFEEQRARLNRYAYAGIARVPITEPRIIFNTDQKMIDQDANSYTVVSVGGKLWTLENLKTTKYSNGDPIPSVEGAPEWSNLKEGAYCDPMNLPSNVPARGRFYNRYAVNDPRNICPQGWHVPLYDEWASMVDMLGGIDAAGAAMQDTELARWSKTNKGNASYNAFAVLSGSRNQTGRFITPGNTACFWWSTRDDQEVIIGLQVEKKKNEVRFISHDAGDNSGMSVRCVKD